MPGFASGYRDLERNVMRYDNKSFFGERVVIDGNEYHGCTFSRCQLVYRGEEAFVIVDCLFQNPQWILDGPAANTLKFLMAAYHKMGEQGTRLVEETFNNIRLKKILSPPPSMDESR
jgi:hypothetical protein